MKSIKNLKEMKTSVIVKLTMLIGACRTPSIKKKQIEESLERYIKEIESIPAGSKDTNENSGEQSPRCLKPEHLLEACKSERANELAIAGVIDFEMGKISILKANMKMIDLKLDSFKTSGDGTSPQFDQFSIEDYGQTLKFGDYEASFECVLVECKKGSK